MIRHPLALALAALLTVSVALPQSAEAGGAARALGRAAIARVWKRDLTRDLATPPKPLARPRTVWRYTTRDRAAQEARAGVPPGSHMTAGVTPGRPPTAASAQQRYGLLKAPPEVRETIVLPKGHPVRANKALGGKPGVGELTSPARVPPEAIRRTVQLPPG